MDSLMHPAEISDNQLKEIRKLEQDLDKVLVAVEPEPQFAELSGEELTSLQNAEKELGVVMLAYERD